jgi:ribonucleoside-triphosphate reductase
MMDISARSLKIKREIISNLLEAGLYPYTKRYLGGFDNHFSTIGLVGMNEAGLNAKWLGKDLTNKETQEFTKEVLTHMREKLSDYQEKYGDLYNLEATPAESTSFRLAKHDKKHYPEIKTAKNESNTPYYTNSSHLPVGFTDDIFEALDIQDELQTLYTSGTVFHAFLGEKLPDWRAAANLVRKIAENYSLPYYTLSPTYSVCKNHGYISGEEYTCPKCGEKTEVYSRITGYYRPVQNWNDGKLAEFKERKTYNIATSTETCKKTDNATPCETEVSELNGIILVTTKTCPNCRVATMMLDKAGVNYEKSVADDDPETAKKYGVTNAPTLVAITSDGFKKYTGVAGIKQFIDENK